MQMINPYGFNRPALRENTFVGRKEELDKIVNGICQGNSYAVFGGRRIGKTSLLLEIDNQLKDRIKEEDFKVIPVYMDLHFPTIDTREDFFTSGIDRLVDVMKKQFSEVKIEDKCLEELKNGTEGEKNFEEALNYIIRTAGQSYVNISRIALLVDEAEVILAKDWAFELYGNLRYLLSYSSISLVITGATDFYESIEEKVGSPLANILDSIHLKGLTDAETKDLIEKGPKKQVDEKIVSEIYNQTGGHPYLIQYIMSNLYFEEVWSVPSIREIITKYLRERRDFKRWYDKFDKTALKAYSLLIEIGEQGIDISHMDELIGDDKLTIKEAIDCLCFHGIVRRNPDGTYVIAGEMFKKWFIENVSSYEEMSEDIQDKLDRIARRLVLNAIYNKYDKPVTESEIRENIPKYFHDRIKSALKSFERKKYIEKKRGEKYQITEWGKIQYDS